LEGNTFTFTFTGAEQIMVKVNKILMEIHFHEFISVFEEWKPRLVECIDTGGNYL
jgi:hypothetical protein